MCAFVWFPFSHSDIHILSLELFLSFLVQIEIFVYFSCMLLSFAKIVRANILSR